MKAQRLANGNLLVPKPAYGPNGEKGDGMIEVAPGDPDYEAWLPYVEDEVKTPPQTHTTR
jgi:hypothetical protein